MKIKHILLLFPLLLVSSSCKKDAVVPVASVKVESTNVDEGYTTSTMSFTVNSTVNFDAVSCVLVPTDGGKVELVKAQHLSKEKYQLSYTNVNGFNFDVGFVLVTDFGEYECSEVYNLKTKPFQLPVVTTGNVDESSSSSSVVFNGTIKDNGGRTVKEYGFMFCHGTDTPTEDNFVVKSTDLKNNKFTYTVEQLETGRTYSVRAYVETDEGKGYGEPVTFVKH